MERGRRSLSWSFLGLSEGSSHWHELCNEFGQYHRNALNVSLHLVTVSIGLLAILNVLTAVSIWGAVAVLLVYVAWLYYPTPRLIWMCTLVSLILLLVVANTLRLPISAALLLLVCAYVGQELAHRLVGEPTMQSSYAKKSDSLARLTQQTVFLLPLLFGVFWRSRGSIFSWLVPRNRVVAARLSTAAFGHDASTIMEFVRSQNPSLEHTTHWWQAELPAHCAGAFSRIAHSPELVEKLRSSHSSFAQVEVVAAMNEIYVAGPMNKITSDTVFRTPHVDGPWVVFPFSSVYRCMVAISRNERVSTHFPLQGRSYHEPQTVTLDLGDAVAFDYNREPHYVTVNPYIAQTEQRVSLKIHYLVYPMWWKPIGRLLGRLSTTYNEQARELFLGTIKPDSLSAKLKARWILLSTIFFASMERFIGWNNLAYVLGAAVIAFIVQSIDVFVVLTSFVHYLLYVATFADRRDVSFGNFKRATIFFKGLSCLTLAALYTSTFEADITSLGLIVVGMVLAGLAYARLGTDRTFFGSELGYCDATPVTKFPYGTIRHPMYVGTMLVLLGVWLMEPFRIRYYWLVPAHLVATTFVQLQEMYTSGGIAQQRPPLFAHVQGEGAPDVA